MPTLFYSGAARRPAVRAGDRPRIAARHLSRAAAGVLAGRGRLSLAGNSLFGVYLLSQVCVVVTYWAVFALGRAMVGAQHAALAVLLMVGISAFTVPTPEFGPAIAGHAAVGADPAALLARRRRGPARLLDRARGRDRASAAHHLCRAAADRRCSRCSRSPTSAAARRSRSIDPWLAGLVAVIVLFPHLLWLADADEGMLPNLMRLRTPESVIDNFNAWLRQLGVHRRRACRARGAGRAGGRMAVDAARAGAGDRARADRRRSRAQFVYFFALAPVLAATVVSRAGRLAGAGRRAWRRWSSCRASRWWCWPATASSSAISSVVIPAWFGLLLVPPAAGGAGARGAAVARRSISMSTQPADDDRALFRRQLSAPHRHAAGDRRRRPAHRGAGRAGRAEPAEPLARRHARAHALGHAWTTCARRARSWSGRPPTRAGTPPPDIKAALSRPRAGGAARVFERPVAGTAAAAARSAGRVIRPQAAPTRRR